MNFTNAVDKNMLSNNSDDELVETILSVLVATLNPHCMYRIYS